MTAATVRRFTLLDAMCLVAATAAGIAGGRLLIENPPKPAVAVGEIIGDYTACFAVSWTLTLLLLNLRQPRPTLPHLACRPGFSGGLAALIALAVGTLHHVPFFSVRY